MSNAYKCDLCGALFERVRGCVSVDLSIWKDAETGIGHEDADCCLACSERVLLLVGPAFNIEQRGELRGDDGPLSMVAKYQLDIQYHGKTKESQWRAYQSTNCDLKVGDLYEGWGATPAEAIANAVAVMLDYPLKNDGAST